MVEDRILSASLESSIRGPGPLLGVLLAPAAWLYRCAIALRNRRYDRDPAASSAAPIPVISVGNLTVGGVGKTPMVIELVRRLRALGRRPAVLTRGYGARPGRAADEVLELRAALHDTLVVVDADRVRGAAAAAQQGADAVVLDDGFQHRRLRRDLDLVLVDALNPWGGGRLLPAGRLREPLASLRRAHAVIITRANQSNTETLAAIERDVRRHAPSAYVCRASVAAVGLTMLDSPGSDAATTRPASRTPTPGAGAPPPAAAGGTVVRAHDSAVRTGARSAGASESAPFAIDVRVLPVCGVGNPTSFLALLGTVAADVSEPGCIFRDHHDYTPDDIAAIRATAARRGAALVVTTRKDWVKLAPLWREAVSGAERAARANDRDAEPRLARVDVETVIHDPDAQLYELLERALVKRGR
ncbi:MAG: tetraacyldisaccharide 4'-kinase [Phycisphaerae bacterium]